MQKEELLPRLAAARNGDLTAQEAIILCYQQRIAGFIFSLTGETAVIEDLAQQVFLKMLRGLHQLKDSERFEAWLFRLARNVCLTHLRRERWRRRFVPFLSHHDTPAEEPPPRKKAPARTGCAPPSSPSRRNSGSCWPSARQGISATKTWRA